MRVEFLVPGIIQQRFLAEVIALRKPPQSSNRHRLSSLQSFLSPPQLPVTNYELPLTKGRPSPVQSPHTAPETGPSECCDILKIPSQSWVNLF